MNASAGQETGARRAKSTVRRARVDALMRVVYPTITLTICLGLWQGMAMWGGMPPYVLPEPSSVLDAGREFFPVLLENTLATVGGVLIAFCVSVVLGVSLGALIAGSRIAERMLYPPLLISQAIPTIAVAPLFLLWFGFGLLPKVLLATMIAFFPLVISTVTGLQSVPNEMKQLIRTMGGGRLTVFRKVSMPYAMPSIFGGLKLAMTFSLIGQIIGEFVGANSGLGYLVLTASGQLNTEFLFAALFFLAGIGLALFYSVVAVQAVFFKWTLPSG